MRPVTVSITVPHDREDVFHFLDVLPNHEPFTDHMLVDWYYAGPPCGIGARAHTRPKKAGRPDWMDLEVIDADPPRLSVEETVSARGRRRTRGTCLLEELPSGGTRISFTFEWLGAPLLERLGAPVTRAVVRRGNRTSLERLARQLTGCGALLAA